MCFLGSKNSTFAHTARKIIHPGSIPVFLYNEHLMFLYVNISFPSAAKPTRVIKVMFT